MTLDLSSTPIAHSKLRKRFTTSNPKTQTSTIAADDDLVQSPQLPEARVQILDLDSPKPVISFRNQVFSCQWATTIGTDIILSSPDASASQLDKARGFSIIGTSVLKVVGQAVQLVPHERVQTSDHSQVTPDAIPMPQAENGDIRRRTAVSNPVRELKAVSKRNQASFLECLQQVKTARGETDSVATHMEKKLLHVSRYGPRLTHGRRSRESDTEDGNLEPRRASRGSNRGRKRLRAVGRPRSSLEGGLYDDYIPKPGREVRGEATADTQAVIDHTPKTWDDIPANAHPNGQSTAKGSTDDIQMPDAD